MAHTLNVRRIQNRLVDALGNVKLIIHTAKICNKICNFFFIICSAKSHVIGNYTITFLCSFVFCIKCNNFGKIHSVCSTMDNVRTQIFENSTGLVSHRMYNT